ncbi:MAG: hypothetical protein V3R77_03555, partial [Candidatus Binatia bacterium]
MLLAILQPELAAAGCNLAPAGDADCDGLLDAADPCPADTMNRCSGPAALCTIAPPGTQSCTAGTELRVDLGNTAPLLGCDGETWNVDTGAGSAGTASPTVTIHDDPIADAFGCTDAATRTIVGSERFASPLLRSYPVGAGQYIVNLLFAETFQGACQVGSRTVDIEIEGDVVFGGPAAGDG